MSQPDLESLREQTNRLLASWEASAAWRNRAIPAWVRSVYTTVPCATTHRDEVLLLVEFLDRFGGIFETETER